jgi:hypothetical protein
MIEIIELGACFTPVTAKFLTVMRFLMQELASAVSSAHAFNLVTSWNKMHVAQNGYDWKIARIMAKSLYDAKTNVTPTK